MLENETLDVVVVGAGILGLALARELLGADGALSLMVVEKENEIARHQTGHNSGVIHSGVYYEPGSLKAKLCTEGNKLLVEYCNAQGIRYELCGKIIVATGKRDIPRLRTLYERGLSNGITGLETLGPTELRGFEPNVSGVAGLYIPSTGIVDYREIARSFADDVTRLGGSIRTSSGVHAIRAYENEARIETSAGAVKTRFVVTCGGLYSDRLATMTGAPRSPKIVPFRGSYYVLGGGAENLVKGLVYPVPDPAFPFLGVHFTKQLSGDFWAGPNAVLAPGREAYAKRDFRPRELAETLTYRGFVVLAAKHWRAGIGELALELSRRRYAAALSRLVPGIEASHLLPGPAGIRAQALEKDGRLVDDFWIDEAPRAMHVRNAPSPAATSSLALANVVAERVRNNLRTERRR